MSKPEVPQFQRVPLVWAGTEDEPIVFVNQILGQLVAPEEIILNFGQVSPPPLVGSEQQRLAQARQLSYVSVRPVARLSLTRARLEELHRVVEDMRMNYDKQVDAMRRQQEQQLQQEQQGEGGQT